MTASAEVAEILGLALEEMEEVEAQMALGRVVVARSVGGFPLDPFVEGLVEESLKGMKERELEEMVVDLARRRRWIYPVSSLGLEMAVRNHLFRQGMAWQVEYLAPRQYRVQVSWKGLEGFRLEEGVFPAAWWGLLFYLQLAERRTW